MTLSESPLLHFTGVRKRLGLLLLFLLLTAAAAALQWVGGAYDSEFGVDADAPAHFVTSLMVRDYVASGFPAHPLEYAKDYYQHYPKIGLGHWPPMFYVTQAAWMLAFGVSRTSVMLFQAVLAGLLATCVYVVARRLLPRALAGAAAALLLVHPTAQQLAREVMAEMLTATLIFAALWCWAEFLDTGERRFAAGFGVLAGLALLTKGTAAMLVPVPVLSLLLTGKIRLALRPWFWWPALIAAAIAGPWYLLAPGALHQRAMSGVISANEAYFVRSSLRYLSLAGYGLAVCVAAGVTGLVALRLLRRQRVDSTWAVGVAALAAMVLLRVAVPPARELRHLLNVLPFWLLLAAGGLWWILSTRSLQQALGRVRAPVAALAFVGLFALEVRMPPRKDCGGYKAVAQAILARPEWSQSVILVSSDAQGEGMFISELAMRERRPGHVVLRGHKVLSATSWFGWNAQPLFAGPAEVDGFLRAVPVGLVVFDGEPTRPPAHHQMLQLALHSSAGPWELVGVFEQRRRPGDRRDGIYLYRLKGHEGRPPVHVPRQLEQIGDSLLNPRLPARGARRRVPHRRRGAAAGPA